MLIAHARSATEFKIFYGSISRSEKKKQKLKPGKNKIHISF